MIKHLLAFGLGLVFLIEGATSSLGAFPTSEYRLEYGSSLILRSAIVDGEDEYKLVLRSEGGADVVLWHSMRSLIDETRSDRPMLSYVETAWETRDSISAVLGPSYSGLIVVRAWKDPRKGEPLIVLVSDMQMMAGIAGRPEFKFLTAWEIEDSRGTDVPKILALDASGRAKLDGNARPSMLRIGRYLFESGMVRRRANGEFEEGAPGPGESEPLSSFPLASEYAKTSLIKSVPPESEARALDVSGWGGFRKLKWIVGGIFVAVVVVLIDYLNRVRKRK